jgi:hypothetical protein
VVIGAPSEPPAPAGPRGRPGRLVAIVAVMLVLTAGWPLASLAISGNRPLAAGTVLAVGPDAAHRAEFTVGPSWVLQQSQSDPKTNYVLHNGTVRLSVLYVWLASRGETGGLWNGLRSLLQAADPSARLSPPSPVTNRQGVRGQTGVLRQGSKTGVATIFPAPAGTFAIEMLTFGPPGETDGRASARQIAGSLRFPAVRR